MFCGAPPVQWWLLVLAAPVLEELVFRGLLQGELARTSMGQRRFGMLTCANLIASVAFVAAHAFRLGILAVWVLAPSLVLGWLRDKTGQVWPCVIVHALYNVGLMVSLGC